MQIGFDIHANMYFYTHPSSHQHDNHIYSCTKETPTQETNLRIGKSRNVVNLQRTIRFSSNQCPSGFGIFCRVPRF